MPNICHNIAHLFSSADPLALYLSFMVFLGVSKKKYMPKQSLKKLRNSIYRNMYKPSTLEMIQSISAMQ